MPPADKQVKVAEAIIYRGPIPPPETLSRFETVVPGAAERILRMAEKEQDMNIKAKKDTHNEHLTALWMAFTICIGFAAGGTILVLNGHEGIGAAMVGAELLGIVSSFLKHKKESDD